MKVKNVIKELELTKFLLLTVAGFINAFGVTVFLAPVKLYDSGISGASMLLSQLTPEAFSLSFFLVVLNIPLFLYGFKRQGAVFTIYSIYTILIYSLGAWLITDILPIDVSMASPLAGTDLLLCAIFGGLISGVGSGMTIRYGGAIDGVEVMSVIFAKRLGLTVGTFVMIFNVLLYVCAGIFLENWILPLYSIVTYVAALKTIDYIAEGFDREKAALIITDKPSEVSSELSMAFSSGITHIMARGFYSAQEKTIVYFVVNRFQISKMREIVHKTDENAFISIMEVAEVFGRNIDKKL